MKTARLTVITIVFAALLLGGCDISSLLDRHCTSDAECESGEICTDAGFCVSEDAFLNIPDGDLPQIDKDIDTKPDGDDDYVEIDADIENLPGEDDSDPEDLELDVEAAEQEEENDQEDEICIPPLEHVCFEIGGINGGDTGFKCDGIELQFCRPALNYEECILECSCTDVTECMEDCIDKGDGAADCADGDSDEDVETDIDLEGYCENGSLTCGRWDLNENGYAFFCSENVWVLQEACRCGPCVIGVCTTLCQYGFSHCIDQTTQIFSDLRPGCCGSYFESCPEDQICSIADNGCIESATDGDIDSTDQDNCNFPVTPVCFASGGLYGSDMGLKCDTNGMLIFCQPYYNTSTCSNSCECELANVCQSGICVDAGNGTAYCQNQVDGDIEQICSPGEITCGTLGEYTVQKRCKALGDGYETIICQDSNLCTDDVCTPGVGCEYRNNQNACNDGSICTQNDSCRNGQCRGDAVVCPASPNICKDSVCLENSGCTLVNNTRPCEDGNLCTIDDRCLNGICRAGTPLICPADDNVCTLEFCAVDKGCTTSMVSGPCNDKLDCTSGDHCVNGECVGEAISCAQPDNQCQAAECVEGTGCVVFNLEGSCSDGNACTVNDYCSNGVCTPGAALQCPDDGNVCTDEYCDPASGCRTSNNTKTCNDGLGCTQNDTCSGGQCKGTPIICPDDGNICTDAACVEGSGCVQTNNTKACNDGKICTADDRCSGGICSGSAVVCTDDGNSCTAESCVEGVGCQSTPLNGVSCNDNSACTSGDTCVAGVCTGTPLNCSDGNSCTQDLCDPSSGCKNPPVNNGTSCRLSSGGYGECTNGQCIPKIICTPGQVVCENASGGVTEKVCSSDGTFWETKICNDYNSCTTNQCKASVGCFYQARDNGSPCSEGGAPGQCINATCIVAVDGDSDCPAVPSPIDIPDGNTSGLESYIYKNESGLAQRVCVKVDITHPYSGDLEVRIIAPNGQYKVLHANEGGAADDIHKTYKFLDFFFIQSQGIWTLKVIDNAPGDKGTLDCWSIDTSCWY